MLRAGRLLVRRRARLLPQAAAAAAAPDVVSALSPSATLGHVPRGGWRAMVTVPRADTKGVPGKKKSAAQAHVPPSPFPS